MPLPSSQCCLCNMTRRRFAPKEKLGTINTDPGQALLRGEKEEPAGTEGLFPELGASEGFSLNLVCTLFVFACIR